METFWTEENPGKLETESERILYAWIAQRLKSDATLNEEALRRNEAANTMPPRREFPQEVEAKAQCCFFNYLGQVILFQYGNFTTPEPKFWNILFDGYNEQYKGAAAESAVTFLKAGLETRQGPFADLTSTEFYVILQECMENACGDSRGESVMRSFCYANSTNKTSNKTNSNPEP